MEQRAIILGLDGATLDLIHPWAEAGHLPNLAQLIRSGSLGTLHSTVPYTTPLAWPSIFTGTEPSKHGILGFQKRVPEEYRWTSYTHDDLRQPALWDVAGACGLQSAALFIPYTFPVKKIAGTMVGPLRKREIDARTIYPSDVREPFLNRFGDSDLLLPVERGDLPLADISRQIIRRVHQQNDAMVWLLEERPYDLAFVVWHEPDEAAHIFWHFSELPLPDDNSPILQIYRSVDEGVGRLLEAFGGDPLVVVCSDHGTYPIKYRIHMHNVLRQWGLLNMKESGRDDFHRRLARLLPKPVRGKIPARLRQSLRGSQPPGPNLGSLGAIDWSTTTMYAGPTLAEALWINLVGREPNGTVLPEESEERLRDLEELLHGLMLPDGRRAIEKTWRREAIYRGPAADEAADLIVQTPPDVALAPSVRMVQDLDAPVISIPARPNFQKDASRPLGGHHPDGILILAGPGVREGEELEAHVTDVAPTVLRYLGLPTPDGVDGRVLEEAFTSLRPPEEVRQTLAAQTESSSQTSGLTLEEEAEVNRRLQDLGYLE